MSAAEWTPLWSEVQPEIRHAQPDSFLWPKSNDEGWIGPLHSPLREDRDPSFSVKPDSSTEPGCWKDHATGEHGSMADLATRLGIDPHVSTCESGTHDPEMTINEFCCRRRLERLTLTRFRVTYERHRDRPALLIPTRIGPGRVKFLDGQRPKCGWVRRGGRAHWYGLADAKRIGGGVIYLVNGEPSVWACSQSSVPAVCTCSGEGVSPDDEMLGELRETGFTRILVVFDRDDSGRNGAFAMVERLRDAGLDTTALELPVHVGHHGDVDDLHRLVGDEGLAESLAELPELRPEDRVPDVVERLRVVGDRDSLEPLLRELSGSANGSDPIARGLLRESAVEALLLAPVKIGAPAKLIDQAFRAVSSQPTDVETARLVLANPEPWPDPVDGTELMAGLVTALLRFLVLPSGAAEAISLWAVHTHALNAAVISPILAFTSPEKRCGKTLALELISLLVPRALPGANITAAALFRGVERYHPTLLIDEADTFLKDNDELRGVLNSGHRRSSAVVLRCEGDNHEPTMFSTWCPKAIALIKNLPSTLEDRSLLIRMRRKAPDEQVERWRPDHHPDHIELCRRASRWVADHIDKLRLADPEVPAHLNDRAADNWRPLLAIADAVGGKWPSRAREAAVSLASGEPDSESRGVLLLHDLRLLFDEHGNRLTSKGIVTWLGQMEDRPWPEYCRGKSITTRQLARLLKPYGVTPRKWRQGSDSLRGYFCEDFEDAFERYAQPPSATSATELETKDLAKTASVTNTDSVADRESNKSPRISDVADVTDRLPPSREGAAEDDDLEDREVAGGLRI